MKSVTLSITEQQKCISFHLISSSSNNHCWTATAHSFHYTKVQVAVTSSQLTASHSQTAVWLVNIQSWIVQSSIFNAVFLFQSYSRLDREKYLGQLMRQFFTGWIFFLSLSKQWIVMKVNSTEGRYGLFAGKPCVPPYLSGERLRKLCIYRRLKCPGLLTLLEGSCNEKSVVCNNYREVDVAAGSNELSSRVDVAFTHCHV